MALCLLIIHHSLTSHIKQLRSCIMDDHLFVNLRTACSWFVTARELTISPFLHFSLHQAVAHFIRVLSSEPLRMETSWESSAYWSRDERERAMWYLALFSVCDKWQCFLHLADHSIFCSKSTHLPYSASATRLGNCHIQGVSQMRSNTPPALSSFLPLSC